MKESRRILKGHNHHLMACRQFCKDLKDGSVFKMHRNGQAGAIVLSVENFDGSYLPSNPGLMSDIALCMSSALGLYIFQDN